MEKMSEAAMSARGRARLGEVRRTLLHLHKALLDDERINFERVRGRVESSGALLQLVLHDEWFAYLRPLSTLIVQTDELLDAEDAAQGEADALITQLRALLKPSETGDEFERRYGAALQRDPAVILAHGEVMRLLSSGL